MRLFSHEIIRWWCMCGAWRVAENQLALRNLWIAIIFHFECTGTHTYVHLVFLHEYDCVILALQRFFCFAVWNLCAPFRPHPKIFFAPWFLIFANNKKMQRWRRSRAICKSTSWKVRTERGKLCTGTAEVEGRWVKSWYQSYVSETDKTAPITRVEHATKPLYVSPFLW